MGRDRLCSRQQQQQKCGMSIPSNGGKMLQQMTKERSANTRFNAFSASSFKVPVNNLGLRRFMALQSKWSRRIRPFMAKLLEQLGGCSAIKAEFLRAQQDARSGEASIQDPYYLMTSHLGCF